MKKYLSLLLLLSLFCSVSAQQISVKSFRKLETDLDARVNEPLKDQNGDWCAIIKVVTTQTGFYFDGGQLAIMKAVPKHGEIWLYVPWGLKRLTISHDKLGILRDYPLPTQTEKATVYEMVLTTGKVITTVEETIDSQWLVINPEPTDASVYLNDLFVKSGTYQTKLKPGSYSYRVEAPLYHTEAGKVEITDTKKEIVARLKPAFGYVTVNTEPEKEAKVIIDGKTLTTNTPCKSEALASGEHTVQVIKEMYQPSTQKVTIIDGQTTPVNFKLQPNFAEINITTSAEATLYVNNEQKTTGTWNGRLNPGVYSLEARLDKHHPAKQDIELAAGDVKTLNLQPAPIYGSLDIITTPVGATISINGKDYGTTPNTIKNLLIGEYNIQLSKIGFASLNKTVSITDGKGSELSEILANGREVTINSTPTGAILYIDGIGNGTTPYKGNLTFGNHTLRIENEGKKTEKSVIISQNGGELTFTRSFELPTVTAIDGNVYHTVTIGTQTWMVENLNSTHYNDGVSIPCIIDNSVWKKMSTPAYCWYNNDVSNKAIYGALYNWYAINTGKLAPKGWHVPTDAEWTTLTDYLGGESVAGGKLKEKGTSHWKSPNKDATNENGFSALPSGYRNYNGVFGNLGIDSGWWSSTVYDVVNSWGRGLNYNDGNLGSDYGTKCYGFSVRCLKDY